MVRLLLHLNIRFSFYSVSVINIKLFQLLITFVKIELQVILHSIKLEQIRFSVSNKDLIKNEL